MKIKVLLVMIFFSSVLIAKGQDPKGELYWVVESNKNVPYHSVVKIYDSNDELVHEVKLNTKIDLAKRKHRKTLVQIMRQHSARVTAASKRTHAGT